MLNLKKTALILALILFSGQTKAQLELGKKPAPILLEGDLGGTVDEKAWSSSSLTGKVFVLFYVAPSQKELNRKATDAIKDEKFDLQYYSSIAAVNMAASWIPNFLIEQKIKDSQKEFPRTTYLRDRKSVLVKKWKLKDNSSSLVIFNHRGEVVYKFDGQLQDSDIKEAIMKIKIAISLLKNLKSSSAKSS